MRRMGRRRRSGGMEQGAGEWDIVIGKDAVMGGACGGNVEYEGDGFAGAAEFERGGGFEFGGLEVAEESVEVGEGADGAAIDASKDEVAQVRIAKGEGVGSQDLVEHDNLLVL
jgi:hypothetical protein